MSFEPPRCPYTNCRNHIDPQPRFFGRRGYYVRKAMPQRILRFACRACQKTFSTQTFRTDYHDHRPEVNAILLEFLRP